jgi:urease accessory protein UreF
MDLMPKRRLAAAAVAVVVGLAGAGAAGACDRGGDGHAVRAATFALHHGRHHHGLLRLAATYLGMSKEQLRTQLASGTTLAQVAAATPGKSAAGLVDYVVSRAQTRLDAAVAAGRLTQAQEQALLTRLRTKLTALVNATLTSGFRHR